MKPSFENLPEEVSLLHKRLERIETLLTERSIPNETDELLNVDGAAKFLGLSKETVYGYVHDQAIPFSKVRKKLYFSRRKLMEWVESKTRKTIAEINASPENYLKRKQ